MLPSLALLSSPGLPHRIWFSDQALGILLWEHTILATLLWEHTILATLLWEHTILATLFWEHTILATFLWEHTIIATLLWELTILATLLWEHTILASILLECTIQLQYLILYFGNIQFWYWSVSKTNYRNNTLWRWRESRWRWEIKKSVSYIFQTYYNFLIKLCYLFWESVIIVEYLKL